MKGDVLRSRPVGDEDWNGMRIGVTRMDDTYTARWPRRMAGICCVAGATLLYVILDVHFLGHIPGATEAIKHAWFPNLFLGALGALFFGMGMYLLIRPTLLLEANRSGIRIYRAIGAELAAADRKMADHKGAICCIPWNAISAIAAGKGYWDGSNDAGPTVDESEALLIACNSSIRLEECRWTGDVAVGRGAATSGECTMWQGSRIPGHEHEPHLLLNAKYLPRSLSETVKRLSEMKDRYS